MAKGNFDELIESDSFKQELALWLSEYNEEIKPLFA
jgi:hypothetical protein